MINKKEKSAISKIDRFFQFLRLLEFPSDKVKMKNVALPDDRQIENKKQKSN